MTVAQQYTNPIISYDNVAIIASSGTQSTGIFMGGLSLCGLVMPTLWTSATISLQMTYDNGANWHDVYDNDGTAISFTVGTSRYVKIDPADFAGINYLRLVSSAPQAAERSIVIVARPV